MAATAIFGVAQAEPGTGIREPADIRRDGRERLADVRTLERTAALKRPVLRQPFDLTLVSPPRIADVGPRRVLVSELHVSSFTRDALTIERAEILDERTGRIVAELSGVRLTQATSSPGRRRTSDDAPVAEPGARLVVFWTVELPAGTHTGRIEHRLSFRDPNNRQHSVVGAAATVDVEPGPVLGPPLRGGPWTAVYDPALQDGHRRVFYATDGKARLPGRFAIDWVPAGRPSADALGTEVLAVADGIVAGVRDEIPEPAPGVARPSVAIGDATGNYVVLDLGSGRFAFYEHLMPGVAVRAGQRVRKGQVIGRLGSTGQASKPHLHFHLADSSSPLGAEGLPYRISGMTMVGRYRSLVEADEGGPWIRVESPSVSAGPALPEPNAVVRFR